MLDLKYEEYVGSFTVFVLFELKIGKIHLHHRFRCDTKNTQISLLSHFKDTEVVCFCLQCLIKSLFLLWIMVIATKVNCSSAATCSSLSKKEHEKRCQTPHIVTSGRPLLWHISAQTIWNRLKKCGKRARHVQVVCGYSSVPRHAGERAEVADVTLTSWSLHRWQQVHTEHMWQTWEGLETLEERICCLLHLLVWQVCWRVVLGKNILGGLERPLSPSLGWKRQTQCWCSGFSIPDVAGVH